MVARMYKCRLCGQIFSDGHTSKNNASKICTTLMCSDRTGITCKNDIHHCTDGSIGFADFLGFKQEEE
jgi:hypothetical protein